MKARACVAVIVVGMGLAYGGPSLACIPPGEYLVTSHDRPEGLPDCVTIDTNPYGNGSGNPVLSFRNSCPSVQLVLEEVECEKCAESTTLEHYEELLYYVGEGPAEGKSRQYVVKMSLEQMPRESMAEIELGSHELRFTFKNREVAGFDCGGPEGPTCTTGRAPAAPHAAPIWLLIALGFAPLFARRR